MSPWRFLLLCLAALCFLLSPPQNIIISRQEARSTWAGRGSGAYKEVMTDGRREISFSPTQSHFDNITAALLLIHVWGPWRSCFQFLFLWSLVCTVSVDWGFGWDLGPMAHCVVGPWPSPSLFWFWLGPLTPFIWSLSYFVNLAIKRCLFWVTWVW